MPRDNVKPNWPMVPRGTPNDGLSEDWHSVQTEPVRVGFGQQQPTSAPAAGPASTGGFYVGALPLTFQLQPDIMPTRYPGGMGGYRVMPPGPSGIAANNAAVQSATNTK